MLGRNAKNHELDSHYRKYCKIILEVIKTAKRIIKKLIANSNNKARITWDIVRIKTKKSKNYHAVLLINTESKLCSNNQIITNTFNNYFTTLPDKVSTNNSKKTK
jgi:hypothetical protein